MSGLVESSRPQSLLVSPESSGSRLSRGMHGLGQKDRLAPTTRQSLAVYPAACFAPSFSARLMYLTTVGLCWTCLFGGCRSLIMFALNSRGEILWVVFERGVWRHHTSIDIQNRFPKFASDTDTGYHSSRRLHVCMPHTSQVKSEMTWSLILQSMIALRKTARLLHLFGSDMAECPFNYGKHSVWYSSPELISCHFSWLKFNQSLKKAMRAHAQPGLLLILLSFVVVVVLPSPCFSTPKQQSLVIVVEWTWVCRNPPRPKIEATT